jgi:hypothetical protein
MVAAVQQFPNVARPPDNAAFCPEIADFSGWKTENEDRGLGSTDTDFSFIRIACTRILLRIRARLQFPLISRVSYKFLRKCDVK